MKKVLRILLAVLCAVILGACIYLDSLMPIITGYAAKNLASAVFVSGRDAEEVEALDLHFSFIQYAKKKVDYENKTVTSRFLWRKAVAVYREGYGVTLLRGASPGELRARKYPLPPIHECRGPVFDRGDSLERAALAPIAQAFVEEKAYNGTPFAFLVLHQGKMVAEQYRAGMDSTTRLLSWSMAKSFTHALVGIMVQDGLLDINAPMEIPQWQNDGRKAITLNDLMQMQSGLEWNENYGNRSDVNVMLHCEEDMGLYALSKPLAYEPGTHWQYSSGSTNVVMRYLREKFESDKDFYQYIRERLLLPLGAGNAVFETDMSGIPVGSSYLYTTPRAYANLGQLYLNNGRLGEEQILPEYWAEYAATPASDSQGQYGSFFWLNRHLGKPDVPADMYTAQGHDGQQIFIIPSEELVVVILSYSPKPDHVIDFNGLLRDIIAGLKSTQV